MTSWIFFVLVSSFFNALWGALSRRHLGDVRSVPLSLFFRGFVVLLYLPLFLFRVRLPASPLFWWVALLSGFIDAAQIVLLFEGIRKDFYSTYSLRHTTPIFTWILAVVFLKERVEPLIVAGVLLTVIGGLLFSRAKQFSWYGLWCAVLTGASSVLNKVGVDLSSAYTYPFVCYLSSIVALAILVLFKARERTALADMVRKWAEILPMSCLSFLAILTGFVALKMAPVSWVVPAGRIRVLFGFGLSYFCLREREGWRLRLLAGSIIVAGTLLIALKGTIS